MAKVCPECGEVNDNIASFCRNCGYDFNTEMNQSTIKFNKNVSLFKSNYPNLKVILTFVVIIAILGIFIVSFSGNNETTPAENITLIKENTFGYGSVYEGNTTYYYYLKGVLKNLPNNIEGYDIKGTFHDKKGEYIYEDIGDMDWIQEDSEKSEPTVLACMSSPELVNVSNIELVIYDPDGEIAFNETIDFDMKKMDLSSINEK